MYCQDLLLDPWFSSLQKGATQQGFGLVSQTADGVNGWLIDPMHLIEHIRKNGACLKWAFRPEDAKATYIMEMAIDVMAHCREVLGPTHCFVGAFAIKQATFLLFSDEPTFGDGHAHLAFAFCVPGDPLQTDTVPVPVIISTEPWVDDIGMLDCVEFFDPEERLSLLSLGVVGRNRDLHTLFWPMPENMDKARSRAQRNELSKQTLSAPLQDKPANRL